ncbi:MAG TPA: hypothetical protein VFO11_03920 [Candidatus Polarisedimenticolaceae bacterium]|nr:hypothetical protein [Candidatus Polarisedimenticolaceae bacterium]
MRTNPLSDTLQFLFEAKWVTGIFWILLVASLAVAAWTWRRNPSQRTFPHVWTFLARLFVGAMWWQQSLWKLPPTYTDRADGTGGLRYWVGEMVKWAAFPPQGHLVKDVVLPHFGFFAPQVYLGEVFVAASLMLGVFTRLGGALGALMAANLWLGLYRSPAEWPWTYFFLLVVNGTFAVYRAGRSLGVDAWLAGRLSEATLGARARRLVELVT